MNVYYSPRNRKPLALTGRHSVSQRKRSYSCLHNSIYVPYVSIFFTTDKHKGLGVDSLV